MPYPDYNRFYDNSKDNTTTQHIIAIKITNHI